MSRQTRNAKPIMVSHKFLKYYFSNLKSENDKTTKKRYTHFWLFTLDSDQRQSINLISSNRSTKPILVSYEFSKFNLITSSLSMLKQP